MLKFVIQNLPSYLNMEHYMNFTSFLVWLRNFPKLRQCNHWLLILHWKIKPKIYSCLIFYKKTIFQLVEQSKKRMTNSRTLLAERNLRLAALETTSGRICDRMQQKMEKVVQCKWYLSCHAVIIWYMETNLHKFLAF